MTISELFTSHGLPDPAKDHNFRHLLIFHLCLLDERVSYMTEKEEESNYISSRTKTKVKKDKLELKIEKAKKILETSTNKKELDWASNVLIEAYNKGLLK